MAYDQGSIILVENPFGDGRRPVLVASNDNRPFQGKQYTFTIISTTERDEAVRLESGDIADGSINVHPSFINPWSVHEVEHADVHRKVAQVSDGVLRKVTDGIERFHEPRP